MSLSPRVIVIGIDGGFWEIIESNLDVLPNFKRIILRGSYGVLKSTTPPVTCPAWKSYSTGLSPETLGIFWWAHVDFSKGKLKFFDARDFGAKEIWDWLGEKGYRSLVINLPLTYPPKKIKGIMIAGFPTSDGDPYTYPPKLKSRLRREFGYRINPVNHIELFPERAIREIYSLIETRFQTFLTLLDEYNFDFAHVTIFYTDDIQHFLWNNKNAILKAYQIIDKYLGEIMKRYPDTNIFIISDHGFEEINDTFYINSFFLRRGYLKLKGGMKKVILGKFLETLISLKPVSSLATRIFTNLPRRYQVRLKKMLQAKGEEHSLGNIVDFQKSLVVGLKQGVVFINRVRLNELGLEYENFRDKVIRELREVTHPSGKPLVKDIHVIPDPRDDFPSFIIHTEGFEIELSIEQGVLWKSQRDISTGWKARHNPSGIFIAYGPDILNNGFTGEIRIIDVAPTILSIYGIQPPLNGLPVDTILNSRGAENPLQKKTRKLIKKLVEDNKL